jgi:hypothetical protein
MRRDVFVWPRGQGRNVPAALFAPSLVTRFSFLHNPYDEFLFATTCTNYC